MANEPPPVAAPHYQCHPTSLQSVEVPPPTGGLESSEHPPGADLSGSYTSMSHTNYAPSVRYNSNMGYGYAPRQATDHAEHRGNQGYSGAHLAPGFTQYNPVVPDPPMLEHYAPVGPRVPHDTPLGCGPHPHCVAMPTQGNPSSVHSGMSPSKDFKDLAGHYLHNAGSQVETFRMRRRPGGFKVLIMLDVDDTS